MYIFALNIHIKSTYLAMCCCFSFALVIVHTWLLASYVLPSVSHSCMNMDVFCTARVTHACVHTCMWGCCMNQCFECESVAEEGP